MSSTSAGATPRRQLLAVVMTLSLLLSACAGNHRDQPKYEPLDASSLYADKKASRPIPEDTMARGQLQQDIQLYTGKSGDKYARGFPFPVTKEVLDRGQERYNISCVPCHSETGDGQGMIVRRGYTRPPSYHIDRLRTVEEGYLYEVIEKGFGAMPSYADQVEPRDRWAIVAYIRALQLSQNVKANTLTPEEREKVESGGEKTEAAEK